MSVKLYVEGGLTAMTKGKNLLEEFTGGKWQNNRRVSKPPRKPCTQIKGALFFEKGEELVLRSNIEVLLNGFQAEGLSTAVKDGDQIHIKQSIR